MCTCVYMYTALQREICKKKLNTCVLVCIERSTCVSQRWRHLISTNYKEKFQF